MPAGVDLKPERMRRMEGLPEAAEGNNDVRCLPIWTSRSFPAPLGGVGVASNSMTVERGGVWYGEAYCTMDGDDAVHPVVSHRIAVRHSHSLLVQYCGRAVLQRVRVRVRVSLLLVGTGAAKQRSPR